MTLGLHVCQKVVDAFDLQLVETCSVGIYASLDGLCSYYWIILQPPNQPYRGAFAPHSDSSHPQRLSKGLYMSNHDAPPAQASPPIHPSSHGTNDCQAQHGKRSGVLATSNPYAGPHDGPPHAYSPPTHASTDSQLARSSPRPDSAAPPHYTPSGRALVQDGERDSERDSEVEYHIDYHTMHTTGGSQVQQHGHAGRGEAAGRGPDVGYHPTRHHTLLHGASGGVAEGRHDGLASEEVSSRTSEKDWSWSARPCLPTLRCNPKATLLHVQFRQGSGYESSASSHAAREDDYRPSSNMARSGAPASLDGATSV